MNKLITAVYFVGMTIYTWAVMLAANFNTKARQLAKGRSDSWLKLKQYDNSQRCIWIHAASLGEFEQGRPLIEAIRAKYPNRKIVLTFYSPSGYEVRKNYSLADLICYLPADTPANAKKFIQNINPEMAFFVKYEYWHFYLARLKKLNIPIYGVSMIFRPSQQFFQTTGSWFREMLFTFKHFYVQDKRSGDLLKSIGITDYTVAGDTRFDRVVRIAQEAPDIELVSKFVEGNKFVVVAGSTWPPDEDIILPYIESTPGVKLIIAPHEVDEARIKALTDRLKTACSTYTQPAQNVADCQVLIINTIGLLSAIYKYGKVAYIGGGFGKGIHNTLEAATYGMPIVFGPKYKKFKEAVDLIDNKAGYSINNYNEFSNVLDLLRSDVQTMEKAASAAQQYVKSMCGATAQIMKDIF